MTPDPRLLERIRNRIVGEMHLGHLRAGDRLPSVRELSGELDVDHRAVAAVFRALEAEGLVEVRGRAGAFLMQQERLGGELVGETATWLAGVLAEARRRRVGIPDFPEFVRSCTARVRLRCACVESNVDSGTAISLELSEEFGLDVVHVPAHEVPQRGRPAPAALPEALREADLVVTTAFHAPQVRAAATALGIPHALVTVHPEMAGIIERRVRAEGLTAIVADPEYGERFRTVYGGGSPDRIRIVMADDRQTIARLDRAHPVLATRAVRLMLPDLDLPLLLPRYPSISPESTREIAEALIRLNMEARPEPARVRGPHPPSAV
jgi:DNA-binding transcriptional regulator YhcF (GntR family)